MRTRLPTPMGDIILLADGPHLVALEWGDGIERSESHLRRHLGAWTEREVGALPGISDAFQRYLDGNLDALSRLHFRPPGTGFQRKVWAALQTIPAGEAWSYKQLAESIGHPRSFRAVAQANAKNPIPIAIPCHRVVAANGGLGGFSCGVHRKQWLLRHEGWLTG